MADALAFDWVSQRLEEHTKLSRLEARGTVRLVLREAGLDATSVLPEQMRVVVEKRLAAQLAARGVPDPKSLCHALAAELPGSAPNTARPESPEEIFRRLGGSR